MRTWALLDENNVVLNTVTQDEKPMDGCDSSVIISPRQTVSIGDVYSPHGYFISQTSQPPSQER